MLCPKRGGNHAKVAICAATFVVAEPFCEPPHAGGILRPFGNAGYAQLEHDLVTALEETGTRLLVQRRFFSKASLSARHGIRFHATPCFMFLLCVEGAVFKGRVA